MLKIGVSYYPEDCAPSKWESDASLMQSLGMTLVRLGEFAWSDLMPEPGKYSFEWLHGILDILEKHGISAVIGTPTAAAPPWLANAYPEILKVGANGSKAYIGVRDHSCYNSRIYRQVAGQLIEKLAQELKCHKNIAGFQIDNEVGYSVFPQCCCPECQHDFQEFLKEKYGTLEALNEAWGNSFWSQRYTQWKEIELGDFDMKLSVSRVADSQRFRNKVIVDFINSQTKILRKYFPETIITTNYCAECYDQRAVYRELDLAAGDLYRNIGDSLTASSWECSLFRNLQRSHSPWVMEASPAPGVPERNLLKLITWHFMAHGLDTQLFFHWRTHRGGFEKNALTFVSFSGSPTGSCRLVKECFTEANEWLKSEGELPQPQVDVAILNDSESQLLFSNGFSKYYYDYHALSMGWYAEFMKAGVPVDVIPRDADFSTYKVLLIPVQPFVQENLAQKLTDFVAKGGILLMCGASGIFDESGKYITEPGPQLLQELFGMKIKNGITFNYANANGIGPENITTAREVRFSGTLNQHVCGRANRWLGEVEITSAKQLLTLDNTVYVGNSILSANAFGKGQALYLGTQEIDEASKKEIALYLAGQAGVKTRSLPENVEMMTRGNFVIITNFNAVAVQIAEAPEGEILTGGNRVNSSLEMEPYSFCVIDKSR